MFQSSPAPKGRCYVARPVVLPGLTEGFNPHRPRRAGATRYGPAGYSYTGIVFQSSPAPKGRCYPSSPHRYDRVSCFNPHRPRRAGATR